MDTTPLPRPRITADQLRYLNERAAWPWLKDALLDWAVMIAAIVIAGVWNNPAGYALAVLIVGNRQHGLALLGHDGTHYTLSHNRKLNDFLTNLFAWWPLLLTNGGYRSLHNAHHKHLSTDDDPEIVHKKSRAPQWDLPAPLPRILGYAAKDLVGYSLPDFWIIVTFSKPPLKSDYLGLAAFHLVANALFLSAGPMVGIGALVRIARHRVHDVLPAPPVAGTSGLGPRASPGFEAMGGCPAGATSVLASLGAPSMAGGAVLETARAAPALARSAARDAVVADQILRSLPRCAVGSSAARDVRREGSLKSRA